MAWYSRVSPFPSAPFAMNRDEAMMKADAYFRANPSGAVQFFVNGPGGYWAYIRADWVQRRGEWATYPYPGGSPPGGTTSAPAAAAPSGYSAPAAGTPRPPAQGEMTAPSARPAPYAAEGTHLTARPVEGQQFVYPVAGYLPAATAPRVTHPERETRPPEGPRTVLPVPVEPREPEPGYDRPDSNSPAFLWGLLQPAREQPSLQGDNTPVFLGQVIPPGPEGIGSALQGQVAPAATGSDPFGAKEQARLIREAASRVRAAAQGVCDAVEANKGTKKLACGATATLPLTATTQWDHLLAERRVRVDGADKHTQKDREDRIAAAQFPWEELENPEDEDSKGTGRPNAAALESIRIAFEAAKPNAAQDKDGIRALTDAAAEAAAEYECEAGCEKKIQLQNVQADSYTPGELSSKYTRDQEIDDGMVWNIARIDVYVRVTVKWTAELTITCEKQ